ncbi:Arm DNA-binding domain-containing protein [Pseudomonas fulva]|uniref:Arm DNA-binding domain-containing protein n=1 Tax=Pseudomonas fulva TaxID=47880 RepID=UPI003132E78D
MGTRMPLTALQRKSAALCDKDIGLADGGGLFLLIRAAGGKFWRFRFRLMCPGKWCN